MILILVWAVSIIIAWELLAFFVHNVWKLPSAQSKLPFLHLIVMEMIKQRGTLFTQSRVTFDNSIIGFALGAFVGVGMAVLMSASKAMEHIVTPYAVASQMIPIIGLAPIVFGILHNADLSRIVMSAYVTFLPVLINVLRGFKSATPTQLELMRIYAASSSKIFWKVKWMSALPSLFIGLKLSAPLAVTASIIVELMGAPDGIGVVMVSSLYYGTSQVYMFWSTVLASVGIGLLAYLSIVVIERFAAPWQPEFRKGKDGSS